MVRHIVAVVRRNGHIVIATFDVHEVHEPPSRIF